MFPTGVGVPACAVQRHHVRPHSTGHGPAGQHVEGPRSSTTGPPWA